MIRHLDPLLLSLGRPPLRLVRYLSRLIVLIRRAFAAALWEQPQGHRIFLRIIAAQIYFTGWQALPLISVLGLATGGFILFHSLEHAWLWGGTNSLSTPLLYQIAFKELGPLLTSLVVIARSGTAVATELGNQKTNREEEALKSMGINPMGFVVFPRLVGGTIAIVCLSFYFDCAALVGGFLAVWWKHGVSLGQYWYSLLSNFSVGGFLGLFIKNVANGLIIFSVTCFHGLQVKRSLHEVPQVTTRAVMVTTFTIIFLNILVLILAQFSSFYFGGNS